MLKDLKNSRTLPILSPTSVASYNLNDYCLCDLSVVTFKQPKIILPSPTPLIKECEVFVQPEFINDKTHESTPEGMVCQGVAPLGTFSSEYFTLYNAF